MTDGDSGTGQIDAEEISGLGAPGATGDTPAVVRFTADGRDEWSYEKFDETMGRLAAGLLENDFGRDDIIAVIAPPSPGYMAVALAAIRAGAIVLPIDTQMPDDSLSHVLDDASPRFLFTDERGAGKIGKLKQDLDADILRLDKDEGDDAWNSVLAAEPGNFPEPDPESCAVLFYTSGTTGAPKGVPLSRRNLAYQIKVARATGLIQDDDRILLPLPLHHVYPFVIGMLAPLQLGLPIILPAALTGPQLARAIRDGEASIVLGVPRLIRALISGIESNVQNAGFFARAYFNAACAVSNACLSLPGVRVGRLLFRSLHKRMGGSLRLLASGGSPLKPEVARRIETLGWDLAVGYGLTETSPLLTILRPGERRYDSVGRPVPGTELKIDPEASEGEDRDAEDDGSPADDEKAAGEVLARGPGVFGGYRDLEEETKEAFTEDGWYRTGDVGRLDDDGYLRLSGRLSTMLVLEGGENISPDQLEEDYEQACGAIDEIGILQKEGKLVAVIVPDAKAAGDDAEAAVKESLKSARDRFPSYQRLADFRISRKELPRTRLGKIRRHKLEELYDADEESDANGEDGPADISDLSAEVQSLLDNEQARGLWELLAERYGDRRLEPASHIESDLGIDSIEWVELTTIVENRLGIHFDDSVIREAETVQDLLEAAAGASGADDADSRDTIRNPESALSEEDRRWIAPRPAPLAVLGRILYWLHQAFMKLCFRVELRGRENLPDKAPYVLVPNHVSYLDASSLIAGLGRPLVDTFYWAGITEILFRNPVWRLLSRLGQIFPVDPRRGPLTSLAFGAAVLKRGESVVWFPEGGRSEDGELKPFRPGIGLILREYRDVPVVPVYIDGTYEVWPVGRRFPRPGRITVHIGEPVSVDDLEEQGEGESPHQRIAAAMHDAVAALGEEAAGNTKDRDD